jgi:CRISPR/Cas system CMR-associated protein Cmr5 small subunit
LQASFHSRCRQLYAFLSQRLVDGTPSLLLPRFPIVFYAQLLAHSPLVPGWSVVGTLRTISTASSDYKPQRPASVFAFTSSSSVTEVRESTFEEAAEASKLHPARHLPSLAMNNGLGSRVAFVTPPISARTRRMQHVAETAVEASTRRQTGSNNDSESVLLSTPDARALTERLNAAVAEAQAHSWFRQQMQQARGPDIAMPGDKLRMTSGPRVDEVGTLLERFRGRPLPLKVGKTTYLKEDVVQVIPSYPGQAPQIAEEGPSTDEGDLIASLLFDDTGRSAQLRMVHAELIMQQQRAHALVDEWARPKTLEARGEVLQQLNDDVAGIVTSDDQGQQQLDKAIRWSGAPGGELKQETGVEQMDAELKQKRRAAGQAQIECKKLLVIIEQERRIVDQQQRQVGLD